MRSLGRLIACAALALLWTAPVEAQPAQAVVSATTQWQQTKVALKRGAKLQITAQGQWSAGASVRGEMTGPDGLAGRGSRAALLSTANLGALVGKVGPNGAPFLIGSNYAGQAGGDGNLFLAINDETGAFGDNQGRLSVAVTATAPPAAPAVVSSAKPRDSGGVSFSVGGIRLGGGQPQIATAPTRDPTGRAATPNTRAPNGGDSSGGGGITVRPQITIPVDRIFGGGRRPSTAPSATPSTAPPARNPQTNGQVDVAVATPPSRLPPTRPPSVRPSATPPVTTPPARTPPVVNVPPVRVPPRRTPPSVAPPVVLTQAPPRVEPIESAPPPLEPVDLASVAPPPLIAPQEPVVAELPPAPSPPAVTPPLIPAHLVMPAAIAGGGAALLLLFLLFLPRPKPSGKRGGKGAASVAARVVSDGRADQALSVKWKGR